MSLFRQSYRHITHFRFRFRFLSTVSPNDEIALSLSSQLVKNDQTTLDLSKFSQITLTPPLIQKTLQNSLYPHTFESYVDRLILPGRPNKAVSFFDVMETKYGIVRDREKFNYVIGKLCDNAYANHAEKMVKNLAVDMFFPDEFICDTLIRGPKEQSLGTEESLELFPRMSEWGCRPDATTFVVLIRSLYQAGRVEEGDEMLDRMKSAGFGVVLDGSVYYGFLKILCGIQRVDHALSVFEKMKGGCDCAPSVGSYEVLIRKLYANGRGGKAKILFSEAFNNGVEIEHNEYNIDPRFEKPKGLKKEKKRLTLPEKIVLKRKKLRKIRLSYVKKPKKA